MGSPPSKSCIKASRSLGELVFIIFLTPRIGEDVSGVRLSVVPEGMLRKEISWKDQLLLSLLNKKEKL